MVVKIHYILQRHPCDEDLISIPNDLAIFEFDPRKYRNYNFRVEF